MNITSGKRAPSDEVTVSVVVPVYNGGKRLEYCLQSVHCAEPPPDEIVVVSDGCADGAWKKAKGFGARVIRREKTGGPAKARNAGATAAKGDILFFIDADVIVPTGAVGMVKRYFLQNPLVDALIGSYDDQPSSKNFLSQYRNLFNHYIHQNSKREAATFWGACGAVRSNLFRNLGGFDENFPFPSIEDIELGGRMKKAGKTIRLLKELQVTHMKEWRFWPMVKTDIFRRAFPWSRLMLADNKIGHDLNLKNSHKISAAIVLVSFFWIGMSLLLPVPMLPFLVALVLLLLLNAGLYRFFWRSRGFIFMLRSIPLHWLYYGYSGISFLYCWVESVFLKRVSPSAGKDTCVWHKKG